MTEPTTPGNGGPDGNESDPGQDEFPFAPIGTASSGRIPSKPLGSARADGSAVRRPGTGSTRLRGARLGAGLTSVPTVPVSDPLRELPANLEVPEERRHCSSCGGPVGRARHGRPGRTEGFCPRCRTPFSFAPKLVPGTLVAGQYEVVGPLSHGGIGWIYLAKDRNVSDRWVVLKGLLNSADEEAYSAAVAERKFLAEVSHPLIVEIYNFVRHDGAGYIVMEYVGGASLKNLLCGRRSVHGGNRDPLPVDQAIAYLVEILPALQYLHDAGLLYCDLKPDNMIQSGDSVKLIDLGGVRRMEDHRSPVYGTVGYQAPEVTRQGTSIPSDLYTVGRTLVVLATDFPDIQTRFATDLPPACEIPLFERHDSLHRLLLKACAPDPADRFQSADELRVQLLGVLREIVSDLRPEQEIARRSVPSVLFEPPDVVSENLNWTHLPALRVDPADPLAGWLASLSVTDPAVRSAVLRAAPQETPEVLLALARAALDAGGLEEADDTIARVLSHDPWEWRAVWLSGLSELAKDDPLSARASFNAVYGQVPGELAPKLALGLVCELSGEPRIAEAMYEVCARTDADYRAPAAFGLARIRAERQDLGAALAALDVVPPTSRSFVDARRLRARLILDADPDLADLAEALESIGSVTVEPQEKAQARAQALHAALRRVLDDGPRPDIGLAGIPAVERTLRDGVEVAYRDLAVLTEDPAERIRLVDLANSLRRWTAL
jgi:serine/threonine-protein kinase PknG